MTSPWQLQLSKNNVYYFCHVILIRVRKVIGKREIIKSIRKRDPKKASILARLFALSLQYEEQFLKLT